MNFLIYSFNFWVGNEVHFIETDKMRSWIEEKKKKLVANDLNLLKFDNHFHFDDSNVKFTIFTINKWWMCI